MIRRGVTAAAAPAQVGYESASQFSREFKRFCRSPRDEVEHMKLSLALMPAQNSSRYVTVHRCSRSRSASCCCPG